MFLVATVLAIPLCHVPASTQDPDEPVRSWYGLRDIVEAMRPGGLEMQTSERHLPLPWEDIYQPDGLLDSAAEAEPLSSADLVELVRYALEESPGVEVEQVEAYRGRLLVVGNGRAHELARGTLDVLRRTLTETFCVDVYRLDGEQIPPTTEGMLSPGAATELVAKFPGALVARERIRAGFPREFTSVRTPALLHDYSINLARSSMAADPEVALVRLGFEVTLRMDRAADGRRIVMRVRGTDNALDGQPRTFGVDSLGGASIELPRVRTSQWASSGVVEPGGALVVDHDDGGASALVVHVQAERPQGERNRDVIHLGELTLPPMRYGLPFLEGVQPSSGLFPPEEEPPFHQARWDHGTWLRRLAPELGDEDQLDWPTFFSRSRLLLFPGGPDRGAIRSGIDRRRRDLNASTISVDVRYDYVPAAELRNVLDGAGATAFAAQAKGRLLGSILEGDALLMLGGVQSAYLQDFDLQATYRAVAADPIVRNLFGGIAVWCDPLTTPTGQITSWFEVQAQAIEPEMRIVETGAHFVAERGEGSRPGGDGPKGELLRIELPTSHHARQRVRIEARPGQWEVAVARRLGDTDLALVVVVKMVAR